MKQAEINAHDHLPSSRVREAARLLSRIIFKAKYRIPNRADYAIFG